jgi:hypothetical protein
MSDFCFKRGHERLTELEVNPKSISWKNDTLLNPKLIPNLNYWEEIEYSENVNIELDKVKGTTHCKYYEKSWIEMLGSLDGVVSFSQGSVLNWIKKSIDISLDKYGDEYYITGGNHRICIAKFLSRKQLQVSKVSHFYFNQVRFDIDRKIEERGISKIYSNESSLIIDLKGIQVEMNYISGVEFIGFFDEIEVSKWKKFVSKYFPNKEYTPISRHRFDSIDMSELKKSIESFKLN